MDVIIVIFGIIAIIGVLLLIGIPFYFVKGCFKPLYHDCLGWHTPSKESPIEFDGLSLHCVCKHCNKEIMQDSQGNWFLV